MKGYTNEMLKDLKSAFSVKQSVGLAMEMQLSTTPMFVITDANEFGAYVKFLVGRGPAVLEAAGFVKVLVKASESNKALAKMDAGVTLYKGLGKGASEPHKDATAYKELCHIVFDGARRSSSKVGKWSAKASLLMVENNMLDGFLSARAMLKKAVGRPELMLNPTTFICPFASSKPGHTLRHACHVANGIGKLYEGASSHLLECHAENKAAQVFIDRMKYAKKYPQGKDIDRQAGVLVLSNEWLMDEANGRGQDNGYELLNEELTGMFAPLPGPTDWLNLSFTGSYDDRSSRREWTDGLKGAADAEREAETEALMADIAD